MPPRPIRPGIDSGAGREGAAAQARELQTPRRLGPKASAGEPWYTQHWIIASPDTRFEPLARRHLYFIDVAIPDHPAPNSLAPPGGLRLAARVGSRQPSDAQAPRRGPVVPSPPRPRTAATLRGLAIRLPYHPRPSPGPSRRPAAGLPPCRKPRHVHPAHADACRSCPRAKVV